MATQEAPTPVPPSPPRSGLDRYFAITERGSNVRTEVVGGVTTFMTMAYILFLNPLILSIPDREGTTLDPAAVLTVTALAAGLMTLAMGAVAKVPFALATGLGLNAVVAFQFVGASQLTWAEAMGVVVVEGLVILLLVVTKFRQAVMDSVPLALKQSIAVGIGLFLTIIGFIDAGFVTSTKLPNPPLQLGGGELKGAAVFVFIFGLLLAIYLFVRRVRAALLVSILVTTVVAVIVNELVLGGRGFQGKAKVGAVVEVPSASSFELVGNFSFGFFAQLGLLAAVLAVFTLMLSDFFDTMGTAFGLGRQAGLVDASGRVENQERILYVDSAAAAVGGALSASSVTTYIESAAGIGEGARTGLASLVTGVLFLLAVLVSPLARIIPFEAAAPALVVVGFLLMSTVREIAWDDFELAIPAFLTIVVMPFTYSITNGIGAGFVTYVFLKTVRGKAREVPITMYVAAVAFAIYFGIAYVRALLT